MDKTNTQKDFANVLNLRKILPWIIKGKSLTRAGMNEILKNLDVPDGIVVDLGGGGTPSYLEVMPVNGRYYQMDMRHELRPSFVGDLEKSLPLASNSIDSILLLNTLEHVYDYKGLLSEISRILRPNGKAIVYVPFMHGFHTYTGKDFYISDYFRYSRDALNIIFSQAGFNNYKIHPIGGLFYVIADLIGKGIPLRWMTLVTTVICAVLEKSLCKRRGFNSQECYPLAYLIEAWK